MSTTRKTPTEQTTASSSGQTTLKISTKDRKKLKIAKARAKAKARTIQINIANSQARAKKTAELSAKIAEEKAKRVEEKAKAAAEKAKAVAEKARIAELNAKREAKLVIVKNVMEKLLFPFLLANDKAWTTQRDLLLFFPDALYDTLPEILDNLHDEALHFMLEHGGYHQSKAETREFLHYTMLNMELVNLATRRMLIKHMPIKSKDMIEAKQSHAAEMRIKTQYLEDLLRDLKAWVLNPKYLDTLVNLPKPRTRIQDSYPGYYDLTIYQEITLQMQDKTAQLQHFFILMGGANMTPPPPWYKKAINAGYQGLQNLTSYIGSSIGFFAHPKASAKAQDTLADVSTPAPSL